MSAHATCNHPATPAARRTCREMRKVIAYAEKLGLKIKNSSDEHCAQVSFKEPDDRWYSTYVLWTRGWQSGTFRYSVFFSTGEKRCEAGRRKLMIWLEVLSPAERRREVSGY
jgi:hypothetical protein